MKSVIHPTPHAILTEGFKALVERLGAGGALRFIGQYESGQGNYTEERKKLFANLTIADMKKALGRRKD